MDGRFGGADRGKRNELALTCGSMLLMRSAGCPLASIDPGLSTLHGLKRGVRF